MLRTTNHLYRALGALTLGCFRRSSLRPAAARSSPLWLAILIFCGGVRIWAIPLDPSWQTKSWHLHEGLPHNGVTGVVRSKDGYIWVGTMKDLARFDGVSFEAFPSDTIKPGLERGGQRLLIASRDGGMWMAMERGPFVHLKNGVTQVVEGQPGMFAVDSILEDREGRVWVGYRQGGVGMVEKGRFTFFPHAPGASTLEDRTPYFAQDEHGRIWCAKRGTISLVEDGAFRFLYKIRETRSVLASRRRGGIWLCTDKAFYRIEGEGEPQRLAEFDLVGLTPTCLVEAEDGAVWIGTRRHGLFRYHEGALKQIVVADNHVQSLTTDAQNVLWVGMRDGGLMQVRPRAITVEAGAQGLYDYVLTSLCEDAAGVLWATTADGRLFARREERWNEISANSDWTLGEALCVTAHPDGGVLIGLRRRIVHRTAEGMYRDWPYFEKFEGGRTGLIMQASSGDWWVAVERPYQIYRLRDGHVHTIELPKGANGVRAMSEDAAGNLWLVTGKLAGGGYFLLRVEGDRLIDESASIGSGTRTLRFIHRGPDGTLWTAGASAGIGRIKDGRASWVDVDSGLYHGVISQMVSDGAGWLWLASDYGLFKVRQKDVEDVADQRKERLASVVYQDEELKNLQGNITYGPGALLAKDGRLWISMKTGLLKIDPARLPADVSPPAPLIKRVTVDRTPVAQYGGMIEPQGLVDLAKRGAALRLAPGADRVEVELTALGGLGSEHTRFRHRLRGFDRAWVETGTQRVISYPRLGYGDYFLEVQSGGEDGGWHPESYTLAIEVSPFFWETWFFRISLGLVVAGCGVIAVRAFLLRRMQRKLDRLSQQNALHRERARIARDLHDSLGNSLTKIVLLNERALKQRSDPDQTARSIGEVSEAAREVIKSLDRTVWALNPRNDTLDHLLNYLGQTAADFLRAANVRCRLDLPRAVAHRPLSPDVRHHILMFVQEALTNVVRHARAAEVHVRAVVGDDGLSLEIQDNGQGFDAVPGLTGQDGLMNMRQRMEELGGVLDFASRPGKGTRIEAFIPWPAAEVVVHEKMS
jgi:signal transduction histidine kinase/ligand-binding sensor domain-containing protein